MTCPKPRLRCSSVLVVGGVLIGLVACAGTHEGMGSSAGHKGPEVQQGNSGTQRFVPGLYAGFDETRAMRTVALGDSYYRAPASEGYEAVMAHLRGELESAGYGTVSGFRIETLVIDPAYDAWTPRAASVALYSGDGSRSVLHSFEQQSDRDRLMMPVGAPDCDVTGRAVFRIRDVEAGTILVTHAPARKDVLRRARLAGAVAVLSSSLASYNVEPGSMQPLEDALRLRVYPQGSQLPVGQISRRAHARIEAEHEASGSARIEFMARAEREVRPLRVLVGIVEGAQHPGEAVVLPSHIRYAGASDNASGFGASLESARLLAQQIQSGELQRPARSLVFLWGPEITQSRAWLEQAEMRAVAAITAVACGDSSGGGGSGQLLERMPDPGAIEALAPDEHTQWGSGDVDPESFSANGLALIARCALSDVALASGGWRTADHPWEGGSDPDAYIEVGVPAVLLWHFSSSWYHTSLDRLDKIDPAELKRSAVSALATALAVASPGPEDLERYLRSVDMEESVRVAAALKAGNLELATHWEDWCAGTRDWLRELCGS
ncbi:MAG: hypothetical protein ACI8QC_000215 [Planctomycetota bacterium]|jgi:hypothetical protein